MPLTKSSPTADWCDAEPAGLQICRAPLRHFGGRSQMQGIIETIRCRRDNGLVKTTLATRGSGRVLVVDGDGVTDCALVGGNLGQMALDNDWAGIVVYGTVRDTAELARLPLGVMALGIFPQRGARDGAGQRGETLRFGDVQFAPGHWLSADEDGIILLPTPP